MSEKGGKSPSSEDGTHQERKGGLPLEDRANNDVRKKTEKEKPMTKLRHRGPKKCIHDKSPYWK